MTDPTKLDLLVNAWKIEGRSPWHHRRMKAKLKKEWPVLYTSIVAIVEGKK